MHQSQSDSGTKYVTLDPNAERTQIVWPFLIQVSNALLPYTQKKTVKVLKQISRAYSGRG